MEIVLEKFVVNEYYTPAWADHNGSESAYTLEDLKKILVDIPFLRIDSIKCMELKREDVHFNFSNGHLCCPRCKTELSFKCETVGDMSEVSDIVYCEKCNIYSYFQWMTFCSTEKYFTFNTSKKKEKISNLYSYDKHLKMHVWDFLGFERIGKFN